MSRTKDLSGQKFGRWTVLQQEGIDKHHKVKWLCCCDCGHIRTVIGSDLLAGKTNSCGCFKIEKFIKLITKHGGRKEKLYSVWNGMWQRCYNTKRKMYKHYGGRGIKVYSGWDNYPAFKSWAIESGYKPGLTIERIDIDGGYEPDNCTWIPMKEQAKNKQPQISKYTKGGKINLKKLAESYGINYYTFYSRLERGWTIEKALEDK